MGKEMAAKKSTTETTDIDYAEQAVPKESRKGFVSMFMIMLGFTFFSASMWVGQQLAEGLDFWGFLGSLDFGRSDPRCLHRPSGLCGSEDGTQYEPSGQESLR